MLELSREEAQWCCNGRWFGTQALNSEWFAFGTGRVGTTTEHKASGLRATVLLCRCCTLQRTARKMLAARMPISGKFLEEFQVFGLRREETLPPPGKIKTR